MPNHVEDAAARAVELAGQLSQPGATNQLSCRVTAAAHLTYMAGLLRGGAVQDVGECTEVGICVGGAFLVCVLRRGHSGIHRDRNDTMWLTQHHDEPALLGQLGDALGLADRRPEAIVERVRELVQGGRRIVDADNDWALSAAVDDFRQALNGAGS